MLYPNALTVACVAASFSLCGQPAVDIVLLSAPTVTETIEQVNLISSWSPPAAPADQVWYLPPSGTKVLTTANKLAGKIDQTNQVGTFRLYFPASGLCMDLIVE